ncbi:MAG TPA: hypothetical protein VMJ14_05780 [Burkholderiales bacterium]|nr:hypothetical protein [Burkholderiales bacterium]
MDLNDENEEADLLFARCLKIGTMLSLGLIAAELAAYLGGALSPYVPLRNLPSIWALPMKEYLAAAHVPAGWGWLALIGRGDYLNFIGIALLASISGIAYLFAVRLYLARRDRLYAALAVAQVLVLLAAASGLLNSIGGGRP